MIKRLLPLLLSLVMLAPMATAQDLASLVADRISVDPRGRVTATGNVEVLFEGTRLTAQAVSYDRNGDRLTITGPLRITDDAGTLFLADAAELDRDLRNGVLVSARMVLDQQLQIAANEIARVGGRYTRLDKVVASSCEVCAANPTPLWEIRAARVIHDQEAGQLYFSNAQFRVAGVPLVYFPRLRLPDAAQTRSTGLLTPEIQTVSDLGTGLKLPYFITFGRQGDLTLTPYISSRTRTLEFGYRQELAHGRLDVTGALSEDDLDGDRGYLFANLSQRLPKDFLFEAQLEFVSDPGYLFSYGYSDKDRLTNEFSLTRVRDKDLFRAAITEFRTLRDSEIPIRDTLPDRFIELHYEREIPELAFGGRTVAAVSNASLIRPSSADVDGRDVSRLGASIDWSRSWISGGLVSEAELGFRVDAYSIGSDSNFDSRLTRFVPRAAFEMRYPLARTTADGGREVLEPIFRFDLADTGGDAVPLEDSRVVEFDEANLFSPSRYPGADGIEDGARLALGASWSRSDPDGWELDLAFGRVANLSGQLGYAENSGLEGDQSEWMVSGRLGWGDNLTLFTRSVFDDDISVTLSETRIDWQEETFGLGSSYIYALPEPAEDRDAQLSEWSFDGRVDLSKGWSANADWRYDFTSDRAARASVGLGYQTECVNLSLSLSRRYASSTSVDPTNEIGFRVALLGVGNQGPGRTGGTGRLCRG
ncbi:MAG: LPS assembly protein LptD [Silicimonas sp.]|nr:LPS assembly protein LptD [Silicimonas sp.]